MTLRGCGKWQLLQILGGNAQALLELQRQQDSTRLSTTRDLTRRVSSSQIPPLPPGSADADAALASSDQLRAQSQSFTGMYLSSGSS